MKVPSHRDRFVKVRAYLSDEGFGYDNWHARQYGAGASARCAVLILCHDADEQDEAFAFLQAREAATHAGAVDPVPASSGDPSTREKGSN